MKQNTILKCLALIFLTVLLIPSVANDYAVVETVTQPSDRHEVTVFTPKTILFDESHCGGGSSLWAPGNASMFSWMLGENGYSSSTNFNESLDSGILDDYDILVIFFPFVALTAGEISAVLSFVDNGGGLLLVGADGTNWWEFRGTFLNPISSTFGISFQSNMLYNPITTFDTHNITYGVTILELGAEDIKFCSLSLSTPAVAVINGPAGPVVATSESGLGRVVCVGGPSPFYMYRKNAAGFGASHFQFSLNVIDWLAENPTRSANVPEEAIITVGPGPDLTPTEVESYGMFTGAIHDHTTHSDGANTPQEMLEKGIRLGFDFFVMTDHSHDIPVSTGGITGALAMRDIAEANMIDLPMIIGAELSSTLHTVGFPLTDNIFTADQQIAVDEIHAQGAIAILCHPTIGYNYADTYEDRHILGYDGVEVDNTGYFFGGGEDGFFDNFVGAADTHSAIDDGLRNAIFVENPSGPNGRVTAADIVDAVLNKRLVIIDPYNTMLYGQEIWVNRYLEIREQAETEIESSQILLQNLRDAGENVGLSEFYLEDAIKSLNSLNPGRALRMALNATSDVVLGIDLSFEFSEIVQPNVNFDVSLDLKNNHTDGLEINSTMFVHTGVTFTPKYSLLEIAGDDDTTILRNGQTKNYELIVYSVNLFDFNTTEFINPILIPMRGIIENVTAVVTEEAEGYEVVYTFWMGRTSGKEIRSVHVVYDDGTGEQDVAMERGWDQFLYTLGPFAPGTELDSHLVVTTYEGQVYTIGERDLTLGIAVTNTTSTTTNATTSSTGEPTPFDMTLLMIIGGASVGLVVVIVVIVKFRK
ncbi:MAG: hypothetical protein ACTSSE_09310 [Candidatus Thorarchaeota archaeon]